MPVILHIWHFGLYADDLGNMGRFVGHHDVTIAQYFQRLYSLPGTRGRPVMDLYLAVLYKAFSLHYLGYHMVNAIVIGSSLVLFYLSLRWVGAHRFVAFTVPLIFALLPNYSSARIVPCSFMSGLSLAFYFLNLYALLRAGEKPSLSKWWALTSVAAALVSGLAYEILLPLFFLNLLIAAYVQRRTPEPQRLRARSVVFLAIANIGALVSVAVFKVATVSRLHGIVSVESVVSQAVLVHFYKLGLRLPVVAAKVILFYGDPFSIAVALLLGVLVFYYTFALQHADEGHGTSLRTANRVVAFGFLTFIFALAIFVVTHGTTGFTATGFENRTAIGSSLGVAFIFCGLSVWFGSLFSLHRRFVIALMIALLCGTEFLATNTIGAFWAEAAERQQLILNTIHQDIPVMPRNSVLLLDGVCPYLGPGIVLEGHQDMGGALQMLYQDPTLRGDVVTPRLWVHDDGIETSIYGRYRYYPYGTLKIYDFRRRTAWDLPNVDAALAYFGRLGSVHSFCPDGNEGDEVAIF
jgi:hypothetical protein